MKLKCRPEDFRVEELTAAKPGGSGRYTFYRLTKRDLGTIEAVEAIRRRWNLSGRQVSYAGLKDRHASTIQYLSIADGPCARCGRLTSSSSRSAGSRALLVAGAGRQPLRAGAPRPR